MRSDELVCCADDSASEPKEGCMATLEAVALALKVLEPPESGIALYDALIAGFRGMIARQQELTARGRQQALEKHGGVSKRDAVVQRKKRALEETATEQPPETVERSGDDRSDQRRVREYVFAATLVDFRQRKQLVQQVRSWRRRVRRAVVASCCWCLATRRARACGAHTTKRARSVASSTSAVRAASDSPWCLTTPSSARCRRSSSSKKTSSSVYVMDACCLCGGWWGWLVVIVRILVYSSSSAAAPPLLVAAARCRRHLPAAAVTPAPPCCLKK